MDNISIIEEIRAGSKDAIQKVYTENAKDVYEFTNSLVHDSARSKEITRTTFVNLFRKIKTGEAPGDIRHAAMMEAYEVAQPYMPSTDEKPEEEPAEDINSEEITAAKQTAEEEYTAEAEIEAESEPVTETEQKIAEPGAWDAADHAEAETPEEEPEIYSTADMAETIKARLSAAAEAEESAAAKEARTENVDDIVLEEDVRPAEDEAIDEPDNKGVHHTQVIDISEAPEESDVIIAEAEEELENGQDEFEDEYEDMYDDYEDEVKEKPKKGVFFTVLVIINIILIIVLLWLLAGLLVNLGVLPEGLDLGYTWFNETIFPIF